MSDFFVDVETSQAPGIYTVGILSGDLEVSFSGTPDELREIANKILRGVADVDAHEATSLEMRSRVAGA